MRTLFVLVLTAGPAWDHSQSIRTQALWDEHALLMDQMTADGFIILGGPIGDNGDAMLVIEAADKEEVLSKFQDDPWIQSGIRAVKSLDPWTIFLDSTGKSDE
jgi:uncharacterized protein YciI